MNESTGTNGPADGLAAGETAPAATVSGTDPALCTVPATATSAAVEGWRGRLLPDYDADIPKSPLVVVALDQPGNGGANHQYVVAMRDLPRNEEDGFPPLHVEFQGGAVTETGVNGVTNEALLAIVADRLRGFQSGPFACGENMAALTHVECALDKLLARTRARRARGVEGQSVV